MDKKTQINVTLDPQLFIELKEDNLNISGAINRLLTNRKNHVNNLVKLLEIIEKLNINKSSNNKAINELLLSEINNLKPLITRTIVDLSCKRYERKKKVKINNL